MTFSCPAQGGFSVFKSKMVRVFVDKYLGLNSKNTLCRVIMRNGMRHKGAVLDKRVQAVTEGAAELFGTQGNVQQSVTGRSAMSIEHELVRFVCRTAYDDLNPELLGTIKNQLLTVLGTTIAGSTQAGCQTLIDFYRSQGGKEEATFLIHRCWSSRSGWTW